MSIAEMEFTPTQKRIMDLLADGGYHDKEQLRLAVDELASEDNMRNHVTILRKLLNPHGLDIISSSPSRRAQYRLMRLLHSPNDGCR